MNKAIILTIVLALGVCGGVTKDKETPKTQTETITSNSVPSNTGQAVRRNDGDADDVASSNQAPRSTDKDDLRAGTKPANANRTAHHDADDRGKPDSDDDD
jgi:hypothetical protein